MKTGSCPKCGYLSLCDEHRKQALADNFDAIKNMSRPANPPTPTVLETTLREQARVAYDAAYVAHRTCCHEAREVIYQALRTVEREALERAARACIEADETGCDTGQFYAKVVLSVSGDSTS